MTLTQKRETLLDRPGSRAEPEWLPGRLTDLLRQYAFPEASRQGPRSLSFSYGVVPLTSILFKDSQDLQEIDDFVRKEERITAPERPWASAEEFRSRLQEARRFWEKSVATSSFQLHRS